VNKECNLNIAKGTYNPGKYKKTGSKYAKKVTDCVSHSEET
jgi:hypothetical protein